MSVFPLLCMTYPTGKIAVHREEVLHSGRNPGGGDWRRNRKRREGKGEEKHSRSANNMVPE